MAFSNAMKKMGGKPKPKAKDRPMPDEEQGAPKPAEDGHTDGEQNDGGSMAVEKDGDGYKTSDGQQHSHLGGALMHVASHHEPMGKHVHVHSRDMGSVSHGSDESGQIHGPIEHGNPEEAGSHVASFLADQSVGGGDPMVGHGAPAAPPQHKMSGF